MASRSQGEKKTATNKDVGKAGAAKDASSKSAATGKKAANVGKGGGKQDSAESSRAKSNWKKLSAKKVIRNGSAKPDLKRADSLNVPGGKGDDGRDSPRSQKSDPNSLDESRRGSNRSLESRFSAIDFSKLAEAQASHLCDLFFHLS